MMLVLGVRTIAVFLSMSMSSSLSLTTTMTFSTTGSGSFAKQSPLFTKSKASAVATETTSRTTTVLAVATVGTDNKKKKAAYKPKWVKKQTLAEAAGDSTTLGHAKVGLKGTIPVLFQQGNTTITTKAWAGHISNTGVARGNVVRVNAKWMANGSGRVLLPSRPPLRTVVVSWS